MSHLNKCGAQNKGGFKRERPKPQETIINNETNLVGIVNISLRERFEIIPGKLNLIYL